MFQNLGIKSQNILNLSPRETYKLCTENNAILVDVREEGLVGMKMFNVPKIVYCPNSILSENFEKLDFNKPLIFADATGLRSKEAVLFLTEKGFTNIANMAGGLVEWDRDNLPLNSDINQRLSGSCMCQLKFREKK
jgi:rhodanese-related sulfurtransferase